MPLTSELRSFLSHTFSDTDPTQDETTVAAFIERSTSDTKQILAAQARAWIASGDLSLETLGSEANRWFETLDEARSWLERWITLLGESESATHSVKDSNGTLLSEGDSVVVIKDLKVKGGSSDLKRGTLIKKIHLTSDAEAVECRVDGSTLVLKTCFLKKA